MENVKRFKDNYVDYAASLFFKALNVPNPKFDTREVKVDGVRVALVHISGISQEDGSIVDMDLWPNKCQTLADLEVLPKHPQDIIFRIGYWIEVDPITKEKKMRKGQPTFVKYWNGEEYVGFSGSKPVYDEDARRSIWTNDEPSTDEETPAETPAEEPAQDEE